MADSSNILQNLARGYRGALSPVTEAANEPEARDQLLQSIGQEAGSTAAKPAPTDADAAAADNKLAKSPKDFTKQDWKDVLRGLKNVGIALKDFVRQTDWQSGWDVADEAAFFAIQVLTTDFVFNQYPQFYTIADGLGLAQDQVLGVRGLKDTIVSLNEKSSDRFFPELRQLIIADTNFTEQRLEAMPLLRENIRSWKRLIDEGNPNFSKVFEHDTNLNDGGSASIPDLAVKISGWHAFLENGTQRELQRSMRMLSLLGYGIMFGLNSLGVKGGDQFGVSFGSESETGDDELNRIVRRMLTFFVHKNNPTTEGGAESQETFVLSVTNAPENERLRDGYVLSFRGAGGLKIPLEDGYVVDLQLGAPDLVFGFSADAHAALKGLNTVDGALAYFLTRLTNEAPGGIARLGDETGSHFAFDTWSLEARGSIYDIALTAKARFSLNLKQDPDSDSFLKKHLLRDGIRKELEVGLGLSLTGGIFVQLGNGAPFFLHQPQPKTGQTSQPRLSVASREAISPGAVTLDKELKYALHKNLGVLQLDDLFLLLQAHLDDTEVRASVSAGLNFGLKIGPVSAAVEGLGARLTASAPQDFSLGNLGLIDLDFGLKPPVGIALGLKAKAVEGSGYLRFDPDRGIYAGAFSLNIKRRITLSAVGILHTKLPEIPGGYSLLLLVNTTFEPGLALGFGFSLRGLGGIMGLHRTIGVARIRAEMTTGALEKILFPDIQANNVPALVQSLNHYFPPQADQFFGGLMARIDWGAPVLLSMDVGLMLEGPSPWRLVLAGLVRAVLPRLDKQLLVLRCAIFGEIDFDKGFLALDARLYDSRLLSFALSGDVALRIRWLGDSGFLISVGGFHPDFRPPASLDPGAMTRITFRLADIENPKLVLTAYFAVTSNTVQFGARVDAVAKIGNVRIDGYLHFDALFQFSPFHMIAGIGGGVGVSYRGYDLFSVKVEGVLEGPGPWSLRATLSFSVWWWDVEVDKTWTWGETLDDAQAAVAVLPLVRAALEEPASWTAPLAANRFRGVLLKEQAAGGDILLVEPVGSLRISQTVAPLGLPLDKFGSNRLADVKKVDIERIKISDQEVTEERQRIEEDFAPSLFRKMTEEERLRAKSFEKNTGGLTLRDESMLATFAFTTDSQYEMVISDFDTSPANTSQGQRGLQSLPRQTEAAGASNATNTDFFIKGGAIGRSPLSRENNARKAVLPGRAAFIRTERFTIAQTEQLERWESFGQGSQAEAEAALRQTLKNNPELKGKLQVVPEYVL